MRVYDRISGFLCPADLESLVGLPPFGSFGKQFIFDCSIVIIANRSWAGLGFLGTTVENKGDMFIKNP